MIRVGAHLLFGAFAWCAAVSWLHAQSAVTRKPAPATLPAQVKLTGWQADFNGDGMLDFCQIVTRSGFTGLTCKLARTSQNVASPNLDLGYPEGRSFVDFDGDGKQDYCRVVGNSSASAYLSCTMSEGTSFGPTLVSPLLDAGYPDTRQWRDVNSDRKADFCRVTGNYRDALACTLSQGRVRPYFGRTVSSKR